MVLVLIPMDGYNRLK